jgi:hypothetical protein
MKPRYDQRSIRISIIITDREHISHWGRIHRSHERFSRRKMGSVVAVPQVGGLHHRCERRAA